jgi:phenylacetic acid degradation operon negative regulatory protein
MLHFAFVSNNARVTARTGSPLLEPVLEPVLEPTLEPLLEPLNARSIVLSVLLGSHPPRMPVGRILQFTTLFDLPNGTVRTALSRLVAAGDLVNDDGVYRLSGRLLERQAQQDAGRQDPPSVWDGSWWTVAVVSDRRSMAERRAFRSRATGARLGELRPDLWLRPANIAIGSELPDVLVTRGPMVVGDGGELVRRLWDLGDLRRRADRHREALDAAAGRLGTGDDRALADAFVALAAAQQFLRVEPQLPVELAVDATAAAVRAAYAEVVTDFQARLAAFFARGSGQLSTSGP